MGSIFYMDYELGVDSGGISTNTPLGWWSIAFTGGSVAAPVADEACTGADSTAHAHLTVVGTLSGGAWATNDAAGTLYFYGKVGTFQAEVVSWPGGGHCHIGAGDLLYNPWKTITAGATAARIAPGDTVRIARSPAPTALAGTTATWTNLSKTVTLNTAETLNITVCDTDWTASHATNCAASAADWKEGTKKVKITEDASPGAGEVQAYFATGTLAAATIGAYQKLSFWIKNEVAIGDATTWVIELCQEVDGTVVLDEFVIPAIPSTGQWIPLTIARTGGGNLGNNGATDVKSIRVRNGATTPTASKYIYLDNIIACTTNGLNLQSLISKNSAEQGGTEGWYGIQSINGTTVLLDNGTNTLANAGQGYSTTGTTPETVNTYKRETIKTDLAHDSTHIVQEVQESGTAVGGNESYQGGYNTATNAQTGETFFDGLNGYGYGVYLSAKLYITLNYISVCRYYHGIYFGSSSCNTITTVTNANNNSSSGIYFSSSSCNTITTVTNANNNSLTGIYFSSSGNNNTITTVTNANNNSNYGIYFSSGNNNTIKNLLTQNNGTRGLYNATDTNYIRNWNALDAAGEISAGTAGSNCRTYSWCHDKPAAGYADNHWIFTDGGTIHSTQAAGKRHTASGVAWHFSPAAARALAYPLTEKLAEIAVAANTTVTVKVWVLKDHGTNVEAKICIKGGYLTGVATDQFSTDVGNTTDYVEKTVTAAPTEAGVLIVEGWAWYVAGASQVYFDDITITST